MCFTVESERACAVISFAPKTLRKQNVQRPSGLKTAAVQPVQEEVNEPNEFNEPNYVPYTPFIPH